MRDEFNKRTDFDVTFRRTAWREEMEVYYRQRKSVWFVLALMIAWSAFYESRWAVIVFFVILAVYSAAAGVRMGMVVGVSFALWTSAAYAGWITPGTTVHRVVALWCIGTLFLLVVWKADGAHRLRDRQRNADNR